MRIHKSVHIAYYLSIGISSLAIILTQIPGIGGILRTLLSDSVIKNLISIKSLIVIPAAGILALFPIIPPVVQKIKEHNALDVDSSAIILSSIDAIVNNKLKHMSKYMATREAVRPDEVLNMVNPDAQISSLFIGIFNYFDHFAEKSNAKLNICVILCENGKLAGDDFYDHYPSEPSCTLASLKEKSVALNVLKSKSYIIIESINSDPGFVPFDDPGKNDGSMLCFPIINAGPNKEVIFVVSILANRPGFFERKKRGYYNNIIDKYSQRIVLEYQFKLLKAGGSNEQG